MRATSLAVVCLGGLLGAVSTNAFDIATGGEGASVVASGAVTATYEGNSAGYSNDLYLELDALGNPAMDGILSNDLFIFNNHGNSEGDTAALGTFAPGTELVFRLHVNNTGDDFFSGPASRNPDGKPHVRVEADWGGPGVTLVSFEDLFDTPEYPGGYNDLSFSFNNTYSTPTPPGVPDGGATAGLLAGAALVLGAFRRKVN